MLGINIQGNPIHNSQLMILVVVVKFIYWWQYKEHDIEEMTKKGFILVLFCLLHYLGTAVGIKGRDDGQQRHLLFGSEEIVEPFPSCLIWTLEWSIEICLDSLHKSKMLNSYRS